MIATNKLQKRLGILQLTMAAIAIIWLVLLGVIPTIGDIEMIFYWSISIFPIAYALPCIPFIITNIVTGAGNILHVRRTAKSYKRICIAKFIYNLIALFWPIFFFFVVGHAPIRIIVSYHLWPTYIIIVLSCLLFVYEMNYANKKHAEESALNLNKGYLISI